MNHDHHSSPEETSHRSEQEFRAQHATNSDGPLATPALLAWLSLFIRVPESLVRSLWSDDDVPSLLTGLEKSGRIQRGPGPNSTVAVALTDAERPIQLREAQDRWGPETIRNMHGTAVDYWLAMNDPCSAVFHLEQLGKLEQATELLKATWHQASFDIGHREFRQAVQRLDRDQRDHVEMLAIQRLIGTLPWPPTDSTRLDFQLLHIPVDSLAGLRPRARLLATSAIILSLTAATRLRQAIALGEEFVAGALESGEDCELMPILWNALAEAYVTAGWPKKAMFYASKAASLADPLDWAFVQFRAIAVQSISLALNGEYGRAVELADRARAISTERGWQLSEAHFPLFISDMLVGGALLDERSLSQTATTLTAAFPENRLWMTTALVSEAMAQLCRNEIQKGVTLIRRALNGTDEWGLLGIIRGFALGIHADLLLAQNSAGETLAILANGQSSLGHALCFDMQRSSAYLLLGQPGKVLQATDACLAMGQEHCLRTLPPVLFRRAIAYEQMNLPDSADRAFHEGYLLISESRSLTPLLNLPQAPLQKLWARLRRDHPEYSADIDDTMRRSGPLPRTPDTAGATEVTTLTAREIQLAGMLRAGSQSVDIADALFLSRNTVKAHVRNLYKKLGVHSRSEAVAQIEAMGIHSLVVDAPDHGRDAEGDRPSHRGGR